MPDVPIERQTVPMRVLILGKFQPGDCSQHTCEIHLIRPIGERVSVGERTTFQLASKYPQVPTGFNLDAQVGIVPREMGTHFYSVLVDDKEVIRLPFTLLAQEEGQG